MKQALLALLVCSTGLCGCIQSHASRLQSPEDVEKEKDLGIRTVGDVTELANIGAWQVSGVGLVTGLAGTGDAPKGKFRTDLEQQLLKQKVEGVKTLLDDPNNALVLVSAYIRPGCNKGDLLDLEVTLPRGSKATSLEGGYLHDTVLRNFDTARRLSPEGKGDALISGHVLARAKGKLLVGLGNPGDATEQRRGRVWGGGVSLVDRPFYLALKKDDKSVRIAADVANRINFMFQDDYKKRESVLRNRHLYLLEDVTHQINRSGEAMSQRDTAKAVSQEMIHVRLPYAYRYNPERYLRVVRLMPLREDGEKSAPYRRRLQQMLPDPADTARAALRLEALGEESIATLKQGLVHPHPFVRFVSAESLVYLNNMAGVDEMVKLAEEHPLFRMNCLLALASSDESVCKQKLTYLLGSHADDLRCGALWVMRLGREGQDPSLRLPGFRSEPVGKVFWLNKLAPTSAPLVHVSVQDRAEVALFGTEIMLQAPVRVSAGEDFIIALDEGQDACIVSRINADAARRQPCGLLLEDVLRTMVELGATYPDIVDALRKLESRGGLPCKLAINVLPEPVTLELLVHEGREIGKMKK